MENDTLLSALNESQREAVLFCDGPSLVIAGAGSGKTRVLTYKIAYLLEQGMQPWQILALTFTNKAAREMKERIARLVGDERARYLQMGTFHSVFARILRAEADKLGFQPNFTIYDQSDARSLVKTIIKEMGLDDKVYKPASVADRISMAKNHLVLPVHYASTAWAVDDAASKRPAVKDIYLRYSERCRQANALDFDDLLVQTYVLFDQHEDVRRRYAEKFQFVLVDEYQDTNYAQQQIVLQLTHERQRVCVVGDDAQSIYSFRGANIDNILNFREAYDDARLFKLEQNYRSTQLIVQAANSLIRKNERQIQKDVYSCNEVGDMLTLKPAYSDREEALIVCQDIKRLRREDKCSYSDFAILYRTNAQSRSFEEQMRKDNIPYRIYGGLSFYQRKEIKDVIAYFRLVANPDDEEAFKRIVNYPTRGIGNTTIDKIVSTANN
ncbi:MAG: UvrD-helicase domain-containing protein, partial [Prevotella sp.]|nr:UvrD-helicase domain-containing protein [Prevotella sp.]